MIDPHCRLCGTTPELQTTEHFFLKLTAFSDQLRDWITANNHWRPNVTNLSLRYLKEGLRNRAITRDIDWGIPVPLEGFTNKRLYVWFEAVIGYLSATKEWAQQQKSDEAWLPFWQEGTKSYYFIGKDNIPFHSLIWPAMLIGYTGLLLPYDIPANEFLTIEGQKLSTSRNWAVWLADFLSRYDPDPLRYLLSVNMPETGDTDFSWREFVRRNNDELVATYGNLVHRVLTFVYRNFNGHVPVPGELDASSQLLLDNIKATLNNMDKALSLCHFREAIRTAMNLAQEANRYLDEKSPWKEIKKDPRTAANALYVVLVVISGLKTAFYPFLPFSSQRLHEYLGFQGKVESVGWKLLFPPPNQKLLAPKPLFMKLDNALIEEETHRLGQNYAY
jgi:methionyl-tRNA synthetase